MIEIRQLWKEFGGRPVLHGLDLTIDHGERVALVGPNGSGKTTLLRCLLGLLDCKGSVRVFGHDPVRDHVASQRLVAYVPQRAPALHVPVRELVGFWEAERGQSRQALVLKAQGLGLDLGASWGLGFTQLSGGMQQKLMAAMALASDCRLFLFDEPTANLDPPARATFFQELKTRQPPPTLVLSSHRLDELRSLVDRVVVLQEGRIAHDGPLEGLLQDRELARKAGLDLGADDNVLRFGRGVP